MGVCFQQNYSMPVGSFAGGKLRRSALKVSLPDDVNNTKYYYCR